MTQPVSEWPPAALADIDDNARRSVSIRIQTSDYGRVRLAAQRLRVRDSAVFRFLLKSGLARLQPLLENAADRRAALLALVEIGGELARHFDLDGAALQAVFRRPPLLALHDLEVAYFDMVALGARRPDLVQRELEQQLGRSLAGCPLAPALEECLLRRYLTGGDHAP